MPESDAEAPDAPSFTATSIEPRRLSLGFQHSCALTSAGSVMCWGLDDNGQLGDGTTVASNVPTNVVGLGAVDEVAAGYLHSCARLRDGTVRCWGDDTHLELGVPTTGSCGGFPCSTKPVTVPVTSVAELALGHGHSCARHRDGTVTCWGLDDFGQVGDGKTGSIAGSIPTRVAGISSAVQISLGGNHSCALLADGTVTCWGWNLAGELGFDSSGFPVSTPHTVPGLGAVKQIAAGYQHVCALLADGSVRCWGYNGDGQLGRRHAGISTEPITVVGIRPATRIAAGGHHTCALHADGGMSCWGNNDFGELGDGTASERNGPVGVHSPSLFTAMDLGTEHCCARTNSDHVLCWGWNASGQLGDGSNAAHPSPLAVSGF